MRAVHSAGGGFLQWLVRETRAVLFNLDSPGRPANPALHFSQPHDSHISAEHVQCVGTGPGVLLCDWLRLDTAPHVGFPHGVDDFRGISGGLGHHPVQLCLSSISSGYRRNHGGAKPVQQHHELLLPDIRNHKDHLWLHRGTDLQTEHTTRNLRKSSGWRAAEHGQYVPGSQRSVLLRPSILHAIHHHTESKPPVPTPMLSYRGAPAVH